MSPNITTYQHKSLPSAVSVHYAQAGNPKNPTVLLLHGYPSSSNQYRNLIPLLADKYYVVAPDLPGFGNTTLPEGFELSFASIAATIGEFLDALEIKSFAVYVFDYGAPTTWRLALQRPSHIRAIITQNGNAYEEGLSEWWAPLRAYWNSEDINAPIRQDIKASLDLNSVKEQYVVGVAKERLSHIDPSAYTLDYLQHLAPEKSKDTQVNLFFDYRNNVKLYPTFQEWFRTSQVPLLAVWGKNDIIFPPAGAEAFKRDIKDAQVHLLDGGHFLLETHLAEVTKLIREFLENVKW